MALENDRIDMLEAPVQALFAVPHGEASSLMMASPIDIRHRCSLT